MSVSLAEQQVGVAQLAVGDVGADVALDAHHVQVDQYAVGWRVLNVPGRLVEALGNLEVADLGRAGRAPQLGFQVLLGVVVPDGVGGSFGSSVAPESTVR